MRHRSSRTKRLLLLLALLLPVTACLTAAAPGRFTGSPTCATSLCHGGAGELRQQTALWQKQDIHSRTYNTLVNARSAQIAAALKIPAAATSSRCTTCHAPFHDVPKAAFLADIIKPTEGVSCESCHGPAEPWIRSHTRPDFSHKDRVLLGLRDLNHLYVRANSCVACHQTVDPALLAAGHPELLFELDGQAVALREMSAQLTKENTPSEKLTAPWAASLWLLQKLDGLDSALPALKPAATAAQAHPAADALARRAAELEWSHDLTRQTLQRLAKTHAEFADAKIPRAQQARRAERLVLALDRLTAPLDKALLAKLEPDLKELFALAQSLPDFAPEKFAKSLEAFAKKL